MPVLNSTGHPYAVEVVVDPYDVFAPGAVRHPLRPIWRAWFAEQLRSQCAGSSAAAYVTAAALQRRYPASRAKYVTHYSSVDLPSSAFARTAREPSRGGRDLVVVSVAGMEDHRKGQDVLIRAVAICRQEGLGLRLVLVGDGARRCDFERLARQHGLEDVVRFTGELSSGQAVRDEVDRSDLFVLASRAEGLPRAAIEAMARCLPVIGSTIACYCELVTPDVLVPPGNAAALARMITTVGRRPEYMATLGMENLSKARCYRDDILQARRASFYRVVREYQEQWLN